ASRCPRFQPRSPISTATGRAAAPRTSSRRNAISSAPTASSASTPKVRITAPGAEIPERGKERTHGRKEDSHRPVGAFLRFLAAGRGGGGDRRRRCRLDPSRRDGRPFRAQHYL